MVLSIARISPVIYLVSSVSSLVIDPRRRWLSGAVALPLLCPCGNRPAIISQPLALAALASEEGAIFESVDVLPGLK
jgi:hypothetical protein